MDTDFNFYLNQGHGFLFRILEIPNLDPNQNFEQNFYLFYTLKLYSYTFEVQRHWINSALRHNYSKVYRYPVSQHLDFCWQNEHVHEQYESNHGEAVYPVLPPDYYQQVFDRFYQNFYGTPPHEAHGPNYPVERFLAAVHMAFQKLYVWLNSNGDNRLRFTNIRTTLDNSLNTITNRSQELMNLWIIPPLSVSNDLTKYEVFDQLVYYLVKGNCSMILNTIGVFLEQVYNLLNPPLLQVRMGYFFAKPGWTPLLRTIHSFMATIDSVNTQYVVFEDEYQRIADTCDQTKKMVKEMYRQLYGQLLREWGKEFKNTLDTFATNQWTPDIRIASEVIIMNLSVGLSFMAVFVDVFRIECAEYRKYIKEKFIFDVNISNQWDGLLTNDQVIAVQTIFQDYLRDRNAIQNGLPFQPPLWTSNPILNSLWTSLQTLTTGQFNLNLADADTV